MLRVTTFILFGFTLFLPASAAHAGDGSKWHAFWHAAHIDKLRNNCWPQPFQKMDRDAVCRTLSIQMANGWKRQNTLADVYFDAESHELNEAGRRKLYSMLSTAPPEYQTIYVVQARQEEQQQRREESIRLASQELFKGRLAPEVRTVLISPRTWSANYIDAINRETQNTMPAPRLPSFQSTTQ